MKLKLTPKTLPMPEKVVTEFRNQVVKGTARELIQNSFKYVQQHFTQPATGRNAAIKEVVVIKDEASFNIPTIFGGTINHLKLDAQAMPAWDVGRAMGLLQKTTDVAEIAEWLSAMKVNVDEWESDEFSNSLKRCEKDAEVMVACYVAFALKDDVNATAFMEKLFCDMTFDGRRFGNGAVANLRKLGQSDKEEQSREIIGMSAYNKCNVIHAILVEVQNQALYPEIKGDAEKVVELIKQDQLQSNLQKAYQADTIRRYLGLAKMCDSTEVKDLFARWEVFHKRNATCDSINVLRGVSSSSRNEADFLYACRVLFFEQRSGIRKAITSQQKAKFGPVAKALFLRRAIIYHLEATMPNWKTLIDELTGIEMYKRDYGVENDGSKPSSRDDQPEADAATTDDEGPCDGAEASTYKSRPLLVKLLTGLMRNKWERTLVAMAQSKASEFNMGDVLDLSEKAAHVLKGTIDKIKDAYSEDFKKEESPTKGSEDFGQSLNAWRVPRTWR